VAFCSIRTCAVTHAHFSFASKILIALINFLKKIILWFFFFYSLTPRVWCHMVCWRVLGGTDFWAAKVCAIPLTRKLSLSPEVLRTLIAIRYLLLRQFISICIRAWPLRKLSGFRKRQLSTGAFCLLFLGEVLVLSPAAISLNPGFLRSRSCQRARGWLMNILDLVGLVRLRIFSRSRKGRRRLENHNSCWRSCLNWTSIWPIGHVRVLIWQGPHLLRKDVGAILRKVFCSIWVVILRGLSGIVLVHVAALADIVPTLSCDVRATRSCLFA
jgi:hypothetical protein